MERLFYDDVYQVLSEVCTRVGWKEVAYRLWPTKKNGYAWLKECLEPDKAGKLNPQEFIEILKMGREIGLHWAMDHICDEVGYARTAPTVTEDARDELQKAFVDSVKRQGQILERMEALQPSLRTAK